ncbi:MAG: tryptophan synthase subunit alpha [Bacillota bacterium]|nr:tryptophan synthase subunit alpha [Bacillota bacterium]
MKLYDIFTSDRPALIAYLSCGDPDLETTLKLARVLAAEGCDLIQLGIPFSDPVAEGPIIEAAQLRALEAGTADTDLVFDLVRRLREGEDGEPQVTVPVVIMTYANTVFAHGIERWARDASAVGICGLILPDVPLEERQEFSVPLAAHGIELIPLIALTALDRVSRIAQQTADLSFVQLIAPAAEVKGQLAAIRSAAPELAVAVSLETVSVAQALAAGADAIVAASTVVELVSIHGRQATEPLGAHIRAVLAQISEA